MRGRNEEYADYTTVSTDEPRERQVPTLTLIPRTQMEIQINSFSINPLFIG